MSLKNEVAVIATKLEANLTNIRYGTVSVALNVHDGRCPAHAELAGLKGSL
jgi:hypothetical protein